MYSVCVLLSVNKWYLHKRGKVLTLPGNVFNNTYFYIDVVCTVHIKRKTIS